MTERFILKQSGNFHTVIDTVENKSLGTFEFKENEFPIYACFHMIIDKMNELYEDLKHELKVSKALRDVITELKNENKQLKSDSQYHIEFVGDVLSDFNQLTEENEQLKKDKLRLIGFFIKQEWDNEDIDYILNRELLEEYGEVYYYEED